LAARTLLWNRTPRPVHLPGVDPSRYESVTDLNELAACCDGVSVHLALTPQTRGIVGAAFFEQVRVAGRSIALVNTARGGIVDEPALLDALKSGTVRDAAVDVWSTEGAEPTEIVRTLQYHPSVLPTTHIGAFTRGVQHRCAMQVAANIVAELGTEQPYGPAFIAAHD
jgi:D-3-phosphoglycerate dehydrogenase